MSYSRWGHSRWYTYWMISEATTMDGQLFDVDCVSTATYGEMTQDFDGVLEHFIQASLDFHIPKETDPTPEERDELAGYMRAFMADIKNDDAAGRDWTDQNWQRP